MSGSEQARQSKSSYLNKPWQFLECLKASGHWLCCHTGLAFLHTNTILLCGALGKSFDLSEDQTSHPSIRKNNLYFSKLWGLNVLIDIRSLTNGRQSVNIIILFLLFAIGRERKSDIPQGLVNFHLYVTAVQRQ